MEYLRINLQDDEKYEEVRQFCSHYQVAVPQRNSIAFGAYNDYGNLVGLAAIKVIHQIEPLILEEGYSPRITQTLGEKAMAVISTVSNEVTGLVKDENSSYILQLEKYGFVVTDRNMTVLKKKV